MRSWKPFHCCFAFLLKTQLGRHKRSPRRHKCRSRRHKHSSRGSVSKAALRFGNLLVCEPNALWKKPSTSLEKNLPILGRSLAIRGRSLAICGRSLPICGGSCTANTFRKNVPNVCHIFDVYHRGFLSWVKTFVNHLKTDFSRRKLYGNLVCHTHQCGIGM